MHSLHPLASFLHKPKINALRPSCSLSSTMVLELITACGVNDLSVTAQLTRSALVATHAGFGGGLSLLLPENQSIGNIGENSHLVSEEFLLPNLNSSVSKSNQLPKDDNLCPCTSTLVANMDLGDAKRGISIQTR